MENNNLKIPSKQLEPLILAGCINNQSLFLKIKNYLDTNKQKDKSYFSDEKYQQIFNIICKWFDKFKKFPIADEFKVIIDKLKYDEEMKILLYSVVEKMYEYDATEITYDYLEEELINFIKENRVYEAMMLSQTDIDNGNFGAIANRMEEAIRVSFDKDLGISIKEVDEGFKRINRLNEEESLPTGYSHLDSILDGGWHAKELYCFSAIPGGGKCSRKDVKVKVKYRIDTETGKIL
jgi:replicative DNA helicase